MDLAFEFAEPTCAFTLAPRQSDVRMVRTSLGDKPAKASRSGDALLKSLEFGGEIDTRKENTSAIEEAQPLQLNRNGRRAQFAKPADYAFVLRGITQKLQGNMPRFRSGPDSSSMTTAASGIPTKSLILVCALQQLAEPIEKRRLAFQNTFSRVADGKPIPTVHLGNLNHATGARRPFHLAAIANHRGGVAIALKGPSRDNFPT
jgi:hypothetical protein